MNKIQEELLVKTIIRWNAVAYSTNALPQSGCPLCATFYYVDCHGCPIYDATGASKCYKTTYYHFRRTVAAQQLGQFLKISAVELPRSKVLAAKLCEQMIILLCSLLPRTHPWYELDL